MARNRPGKRERAQAAKASVISRNHAVMARNAAEAKPERPMYGAPLGFRASTVSRASLKKASHTATFSGPRGFFTPKDLVPATPKGEHKHGLLAGRRTEQERREALALVESVKKD